MLNEDKWVWMRDLKALFKMGIVNANLMTVFVGFWLAHFITETPFLANWDVLLLTLLGSGLVIAGGCVMNNWFDVDIDPVMERTQSRPTVTGSISLTTAFIIGIVFTVVGIGLLLVISITAAIIAFIGWFLYVVLYTMWSKRRYTLNTVIGSVSGAIPPLIGWTAVEQNLSIVPVTLFLIMFIWQIPHFLALAIKKNDEYTKANIPMLPTVKGFQMAKRQIVIYIICLLPLPFFLMPLGSTFMILATLLNIGWLLISLKGFFAKDDLKWANRVFIYSLNYLTVLFLLMVVSTIEFPFG
nr:heme o synthase [Lentibacillus saliphilus]